MESNEPRWPVQARNLSTKWLNDVYTRTHVTHNISWWVMLISLVNFLMLAYDTRIIYEVVHAIGG
jgi:hypothetical protein